MKASRASRDAGGHRGGADLRAADRPPLQVGDRPLDRHVVARQPEHGRLTGGPLAPIAPRRREPVGLGDDLDQAPHSGPVRHRRQLRPRDGEREPAVGAGGRPGLPRRLLIGQGRDVDPRPRHGPSVRVEDLAAHREAGVGRILRVVSGDGAAWRRRSGQAIMAAVIARAQLGSRSSHRRSPGSWTILAGFGAGSSRLCWKSPIGPIRGARNRQEESNRSRRTRPGR